MAKFTYLLGAGASAKALPVVNQIPDSIKEVKEQLNPFLSHFSDKEYFEFNNQRLSNSKKSYFEDLIADLSMLETESRRHASIDTYAKKIFINNNRDLLNHVKNALCAYFALLQIQKKPDPRYDTFFASILDRIHVFPDNINILSWNYDHQIEIAYSLLSESDSIQTIQNILKVNSKNKIDLENSQSFNIYKLNGSASMAHYNGFYETSFLSKYTKTLEKETIETVVKNYALTYARQDVYPGLSFAWENKENFNEHIKELCANTEYLIVIGYSFPFYNRAVDKHTINSMPKLKKIYIQDMNFSALESRINAITGNSNVIIEYVGDTEQFYLPNELE